MKNKTNPAPTIQPAHTAEEFKQLYNKLCQDTGFQIAFEPRWAQSRDQGDYRLVIVTSVIPLPK